MGTTRNRMIGWLTLAVLAGTPALAAEVDEVIAKHIAAHGGREAWQAIRSMKVTGSFSAFSKTSPFTMHRKRERGYHLDHVLDDKRVVIGYDGQKAWWENHWFQQGAQELAGPDLAVVMRDVEFETALFDVEASGHRVKLLGPVDLDGIETLGIELTRSDESVETWYLDPKTYLAVGRDSPGSDFGRPMPQRTFFEDYRDVRGAMVPHFSETQWYTRDRVMRIERIEVNVEIDDALFRMPAPPGMQPILALAGDWRVATEQRDQPEAPWQESERTTSIESLVKDTLLRESFTTERGYEVVWTLSYDRFRNRYQLTQINDARGLLNVLQGELDEDGRLVASNLETGTTWEGFGMTFHSRVSFLDIDDNGFKMEFEISTDGGENWFLAAKSAYTRAEP